jgi:hypothetical protein
LARVRTRRFVKDSGSGETVWQIGRDGNDVTVAHGPIGRAPTPLWFRFASTKEADAYIRAQVKKMKARGFTEMPHEEAIEG